MQLFSHRYAPPLTRIQTQIKPYSFIMEFLGYGTESMSVQRLLFDSAFDEQKFSMPIWLVYALT